MLAKRESFMALVLMSVLTASCSGPGVAGDAKAGPQSKRSSQSSSVSSDKLSTSSENLLAPAVPKALNAKPFLSNDEICKIISPEQAKRLGLTKPQIGERTDNRLEVSCSYDSGKPMNNSIGAGFSVANHNGLSDIYAKKSRQKSWKPFKTKGYPGVIVDQNSEGQNCIAYLGVTDKLAIQLSYFGKKSVSAEEACKRDKKLAGMVISNLKLQE